MVEVHLGTKVSKEKTRIKKHDYLPVETNDLCKQIFSDWPQDRGSHTTTPTIGIVEGEGIGRELMDVCQLILEQVGAYTEQQFNIESGGLIGIPAFNSKGTYVTSEMEQFCRTIHASKGAILCGPGGGRFVYDLRRRLDLFCKLTPLKPTRALYNIGPLRPESLSDVDIMMVRENLGGLYQGKECHEGELNSSRVNHRFGYDADHVEQIIRTSATLAELRDGRLCVIYKPGGIPSISKLWKEIAEQICAESAISLTMLEVDNACYQIIADAQAFDVVVAPNMFGDVLADGASVLLGSRGLSFSANFSADGIGIYQTGHGAAHNLASTDKANPIGQVYSLVFMLREHFGLNRLAWGIEQGVEDVLAAGSRTADIMDSGCHEVGTQQMGKLIADAACIRLSNSCHESGTQQMDKLIADAACI